MEQHAAKRHDDRDVTGFAQDHGSDPSEDAANVSEAKEREAEEKEDSESETVPRRVGETSGKPLGELQRNLLHMYRSQEMTDLSIRVGSAVFRCHRVVVCAMSGLFKRLLTEEPARRLVILQNEDPDVFRNVMEYIYEGQCAVEDNVGDFLNLVLKLDISSLLGKMESSLESMISPGNCITILESAASLTDQKLFGVATNYVITHFFDDDITDQLGKLSLDQIIEMLDNDDLPVS
ncbi:hypothetical protein V1264_006203 [Littorina saxatilis]|uniref:BTB domain-containing protein n=1 Tax=Littorina saxatilis TaxID=31220 RepID=A0AAN9AYA0_9CAEN